MGATFTNIQLLRPDKDKDSQHFSENVTNEIVELFERQGYRRVETEEEADRSVIVSAPDSAPWVSVYDEETERMDIAVMDTLAYVLSNNLGTTVLGIMVYDDDMLFLSIYRKDTTKEIFASDEETLEIDFGSSAPEVWTGILKPEYNTDNIRQAWEERGMLVTGFLHRFAGMTGIPAKNINSGYYYFMEENPGPELVLHFVRDVKELLELGPTQLKWIAIADGIGEAVNTGKQVSVTADIVNDGLQATGFQVIVSGKAIDENLLRPERVVITINRQSEMEKQVISQELTESVSFTGVKLFYATFQDLVLQEGLRTAKPLSVKEEQKYYSALYRKAIHVETEFTAIQPGDGSIDIFYVPLANVQEGSSYYSKESFIVE